MKQQEGEFVAPDKNNLAAAVSSFRDNHDPALLFRRVIDPLLDRRHFWTQGSNGDAAEDRNQSKQNQQEQQQEHDPVPTEAGTRISLLRYQRQQRAMSRMFLKIGTGCAFLVSMSTIATYTGHRMIARTQTYKQLVKAPMNSIYRECPPPEYEAYGQYLKQQQQQPLNASANDTTTTTTIVKPPHICMTTLTDTAKADWWQRLVKWRDFGDLMQETWPNKMRYCNLHNITLVDSSHQLDTTRPPSWSKIRAVQSLMDDKEYDTTAPSSRCDWIFWLDADTVFMNSTKSILDFLPSPRTTYDLVLTHQKGKSWNAGAWIIKNGAWGRHFLQTWWNMKQFVKRKGQAASGDNDALKHYLQNDMNETEYNMHIVAPKRCQFNSVAKFYTPEFASTLTDEVLQSQAHIYRRIDFYHKGDLIAHVAGVNNKIATTKELLKDAV